MKRLISLLLSVTLVVSALVVAPIGVSGHTTANYPCKNTGLGVETSGITLDDYGASGAIEFCLQYYPGVGDINIVGASGYGQYIKNLQDYNHALSGVLADWRDKTNAIYIRNEDECVTTKNSNGNTYHRKITRIRLQNDVFGLWETIWDSNNPDVPADYYLQLPQFDQDEADRLVFDIATC